MTDIKEVEIADVQEAEPEKIDKGTYWGIKNNFAGDVSKGFSWYSTEPKAATEDEAKASLDALLKRFNAQQVVSLIVTSIRAGQRVKAQNVLNSLKVTVERPSTVTPGETITVEDAAATKEAIEKRRSENPVLLTLEEAEAWVPGTRGREVTAQSLMAKAYACMREAKNSNDPEFIKAKKAEARALNAQAAAMLDSEMEDDEAEIESQQA